MPPITVVENEYVTLQYLPDKKMLYHTVHKPVDEEVFKRSLNAGVDLFGKYEIHKWLSDDRKNGPLSDSFSQWAVSDWIPRAIAAGWKYWANVVPQELIAANTLSPLMDILFDQGLRMMVFKQPADAINWLDKVA